MMSKEGVHAFIHLIARVCDILQLDTSTLSRNVKRIWSIAISSP
jgi:hypothetical protein